MHFVMIFSKRDYLIKFGKFQCGNPDVMLKPLFGFSHMVLDKKPHTWYAWNSKVVVLTKQPLYKTVYEIDPPGEIVKRTVTHSNTRELLQYQSGKLLIYKDGVLEARIPHWIDIRNDCKTDPMFTKYTNVPIADKHGRITDISNYLGLIDGLNQEMNYTLKNL